MAEELHRPLLEEQQRWRAAADGEDIRVGEEMSVSMDSQQSDGEAVAAATAAFLAEGLTARVDLTQARLLEPLLLHSRARSRGDGSTKPQAKLAWGRLLLLAAPETCWILAGLLSLTLRLPFNLAMPHFISTAIAATLEIVNTHDPAGLAKVEECVKGFFVAALCNAALDFFNWNFFVVAQQRMIRRLRQRVFSAILSQEMAFFDEQSTGDLISRLTSDVGEMANDLTWVFRWSLEAVVRVTGISLYLFYVSWRMALLTWLVAPLVAVVNRVYGDFVQRNSQKTQSAIAEANEVAHEAISCVRTVHSFAQEPYEQARYASRIQQYYELSIRQGLLDGMYFMGISCFLMQTVLQGATLVGGVYLVLKGQMDGDHLIACMFYQSQLMEYMNNLLNVFTNLYKSSGAAAKVFELMDRVPARQLGVAAAVSAAAVRGEQQGSSAPARAEGRVELRDVHFAYPTRPTVPILGGVSFVVQPGQVVALVGGSGAGKSTVFHQIENFYRPTQGQVLLDNMSVQSIDHRWLHQAVGLVAQEPVLFRGSIAANIRYSRLEIRTAARLPADNADDDADAAVVEAARAANAHGFVSALPCGYLTQVGERGVQLSGGQKQRIAIARALLQDPRVLLLDEATSALDAESEALVQAALERAMVGRSVLVIAHRLSTVVSANLIVVMDRGRVVERGTHAQLMAARSDDDKDAVGNGATTYRSLVARQTAPAMG